MIHRVLAVLSIAACDRSAPKDPPAPPQEIAVVPDITTIDWRNHTFELASLGSVKATEGRAEFRLVEGDTFRADQSPTAKGANGSLVLAPAHFADLDGDDHDEALIPFEMRTTQPDEAQHLFGVFAYTLRSGDPIQIGVVSAPVVLEVDGAVIKASDPPRTWRWVPAARAFVAE